MEKSRGSEAGNFGVFETVSFLPARAIRVVKGSASGVKRQDELEYEANA